MRRKASETTWPACRASGGFPRVHGTGLAWQVVLCVLWACAVQAQEGTLHIAYDLYLDRAPPLHCRAELASSKGLSVFYWNNGEGGSEITSDDFGALQIQVRDSDPIGTVNFADRGADSLYTRGSAFNSPYLLAEPLPEIRWQLDAETRQLGGFTVHKARAAFRGRSYTAWFCPDIPVPVGPWKLQGLPGAILEAYDEEAFFRAVFRSVRQSPEAYIPDPELFRVAEVIDLNGFRELQENMAGELIRKIRSKLPRGAQLNVEETSAEFLERAFGER
ncbi:MAG TPA: GLPGLI family protein [Robiginitalea sp.]|nr:GLPGLI family protein [Robiginitalea sp.]